MELKALLSRKIITAGMLAALLVIGGIATAIAQSTSAFNLNSPASFPMDI